MRLTAFRNLKAQQFDELDIPLDQLSAFLSEPIADAKEGLPLLKLATFNGEATKTGAKRSNKSVKSLTGVELDYDAGIISLENAQEIFKAAGLRVILYSTPSWTKDKPKWRALLPFAQERFASQFPAIRRQCFQLLEGLLPKGSIAPESRTLSQAYYYGHLKDRPIYVLEAPGQFIDLEVAWLKVVDGGASKEEPNGALDPKHHVDAGELNGLVENILAGENLHDSTVRLAMILANRGLRDRPTLLTMIQSLLGNSRAPRDERYAERWAGVERGVTSALAKVAFDDLDAAAREPGREKLPSWRNIQEYNQARGYGEELEPPIIVPNLFWKDISLLSGEGGRGKTTLMLQMAVSMAVGVEFLSFVPLRPEKVAFFTQEDDSQILWNKARAFCQSTGFDWTIIEKNLVIVWLDMRFTKQEKFRLESADLEVIEALASQIQGAGVSMVMFDPLASFAGEETNEGFRQVIRACRHIIRTADCGVLLAHHTGKTSRDDQYAARGGSALVDGSRMAMNLHYLEPDEFAAATGVDTQWGGYKWGFEKTSHIQRPEPKYLLRADRFSFSEIPGLTREQRTSAASTAQERRESERQEQRAAEQRAAEKKRQEDILKAVQEGAVSKQQIAQTVGGNATTLRSSIDRMLIEGVLVEDRSVRTRGGLHPIGLGLKNGDLL